MKALAIATLVAFFGTTAVIANEPTANTDPAVKTTKKMKKNKKGAPNTTTETTTTTTTTPENTPADPNAPKPQ